MRRNLLLQLERAHEAGKGVTEEEVLDGVHVLGLACMLMRERYGMPYCYERVKEGFVCLLGEDHAKSVEATYGVVAQTAKDDDERMVGLSALWDLVKLSLPDEAVTYAVADQLGAELRKKGHLREAKVLYLPALKERRRVLWEEHKDTLASLNNIGCLLDNMGEYRGALDYYQ